MSKQKIDQAKIDATLITWTGLADIANHQWSEKLCKDMAWTWRSSGDHLQHDDWRSARREPRARAGAEAGSAAGDGRVRQGQRLRRRGCAGRGRNDLRSVFLWRDLLSGGRGAPGRAEAETTISSARLTAGFTMRTNTSRAQASSSTGSPRSSSAARTDTKAAFRKAEELAAQVTPGSEHLVSIGLLSGSAMPFDSEVRGMFLGHSLNHTLGHFYRALLEGFSTIWRSPSAAYAPSIRSMERGRSSSSAAAPSRASGRRCWLM